MLSSVLHINLFCHYHNKMYLVSTVVVDLRYDPFCVSCIIVMHCNVLREMISTHHCFEATYK